MARRKRGSHRKRPKTPPARPKLAAGGVLMVGWTVAALTTLVCEAIWLIGWLYSRARAEDVVLAVFVRYILFGAAVHGVATLVLTIFACRARERPPAALVAFVVCIAALPLGLFWLS